ncbi:MAG: menaquinone biosynthesis protein [Candidatus Melainabacteria bacterium]|nr:menaquinone biosynthesis protein [Candidatus Melainabacteria bacterium]
MHKNTESKSNRLTLGQVDFINCLPINIPIEEKVIEINATIKSEIPSTLNKLVLSGKISSNGPADSVLLFSKYPIEELERAYIALSFASATSNKLTEIILNKYMHLNVTLKVENLKLAELPKGYSAALLIGDHALFEFSRGPRDLFLYDMGSLWKMHTGLPMVFGIWVVRNEVMDKYPEEVRMIAALLNKAKEKGLGDMFDTIVKKSINKVGLSQDFYRTYFEHLSYELNEECKKGLVLFEKICSELNQKALIKV